MDTKSKNFHRVLLVGYFGLLCLFLLVYFLSGYLPAEQASLIKLLQDLFLNLSIALTISFGSYFLLRPLLEDRDRKNLEDFQKAALDLLTLEKGVREAGVVRIYETLDDDSFRERLNGATERVYIFSIWLDRSEDRLGKMIEGLATKGVEIRILQANPDSKVCQIRADGQKTLFPDESIFDPVFISRITNQNNVYFKEIKEDTGIKLEVRQFDLIPPFSLILIDDSAFVGFYGYGERTTTFPWIEFKLDEGSNNFSYLRSFILNQFESIWDKSAIVA